MDYKQFTDLLLQAGQELAKKGQSAAEQHLQLPPEGPERDEFMKTLGKSAAAGSILAVLLGTSGGRRLSGTAIKLGGAAALGTLAYNAFQSWQAGQAGGKSLDQLSGPDAANRSLAILKAMVAAAKADGHIDDQERTRIETQLNTLNLDPETLNFFKAELAKPIDSKSLAAEADSPAAAAEIYLASLLVINDQNPQEKEYLKNLATELKLAPELAEAIENHAKA